MAYSPSPHTSALHNLAGQNFGARYRATQRSHSPPPQPTMNKRDKKRQVITDRFTDIVNNFAERRDFYYSQRLIDFTTDMNYISHAQIYDNTPLEESNFYISGPQGLDAFLPTANGPGQPPHAQPRQRLGKHGAGFIQEVNDALEEKDADLVRLAETFNSAVEQLGNDYEFNMNVAREEHRRLVETLRQRLVANVQSKKAALQRDKEKLDIADTNALLYHPNQFSMTNTASPGGPAGNRKTRHTRHRLDADDVETAMAMNGKRKRRLVAETDSGSPVRESDTLNLYKVPDSRGEEEMVQVYTIDKLFTDKELNAHLQAASLKVLADQQAVKRRKVGNGTGNMITDTSDFGDNAEDERDDGESIGGHGLLEAVSMERSTTNQSYHATRSTRTLNLATGANKDNLGGLAGRQTAAGLIGTFHREKKKEDDYNRAAPLSADGVEHDLALISKAIEAEDQDKTADTDMLAEITAPKPDYVQFPDIS